MKKINFFLILFLIFLISCGNVGKILRNEKINSTDEFLVKKKDPLILPPDLDKVPEPGSVLENKKKEKDSLKEIINKNKNKKIKSSTSSSVEESILKRLPNEGQITQR